HVRHGQPDPGRARLRAFGVHARPPPPPPRAPSPASAAGRPSGWHATASGRDAAATTAGADALGETPFTRQRGDSRRRVPSADSADALDRPRAYVEGGPCTPGRSAPVRCASAPTRRAAAADA